MPQACGGNLRDDAKAAPYVYVEPLELHGEVLRCNPEAFECSAAVVHACIRCLCFVSKIAGKGAGVVEHLIQVFFKRLDTQAVENNQRQAIFLFLDCSFSLISQKGDPADRCVCSGVNSGSPNNSDSEPNFCCRRKGLLELYKWLQGHLPTEVSFNHEKYLEICVNFISSFLQLWGGLSRQPLGTKLAEYCISFRDVIHYDHQVLLDYLISKDTGISCVKYSLRCLSLKKLFPYNPGVLLKRLKKFQDLCCKEEGFLQKTDPNPNL
ncbi:hypothetical protein K1719_029523 [Acacia pycnantha]|nr:hypothetical protein K1719_029523 [Acacia pycnantha]